ncbi:MAG: hypothetical protein NVS3B2_06130 [Ramlibacter sp.]
MTPSEKLARSRLAIVEYLARNERRDDDPGADAMDAEPGAIGDKAKAGRRERRPRRGGWIGGMASTARAWWEHHPAQMALEMASPVLSKAMRKRPFQILAVSAGIGALLVVTRPWRLVSLTTLVVAIVKSSQLSGVVMSALTDAQGWHAAQRGRGPEL